MKTFLIILLFILLAATMIIPGCCPAQETEIKYRDRIISVVPPVIHDTLKTFVQDTIITGQKIREITDSLTGKIRTDTVIRFKYYPRQQCADIEVKPDPVKIYLHDTVTINHYPKPDKETFSSFMAKVGLFAAGLGIGFLLSILRE
jgi:hypothetical protein